MLQEAANAKLETGANVHDMLSDMQTKVQAKLKAKQDSLATTRTLCDTKIAAFKQEMTSETQNRGRVQALTFSLAAKEGAYEQKCAQLEQRRDDSQSAWNAAEAETNAAKTEEYNQQVLECNTLQSALMVLTNKQAMMQTGAEAKVETMSREMKDKLYDVVARETNVVDADTVMLAISESKNTYSTAAGSAGGFGTIVGIVMGLHNHCLEQRDRLSRELGELNDHLAEQKSLTKSIYKSDEESLNNCNYEYGEVMDEHQIAETELIDTQNNLANAIKSLSDEQRSCNDAVTQATNYIREFKRVDATLTEVLAVLDSAFAKKESCAAANKDSAGNQLTGDDLTTACGASGREHCTISGNDTDGYECVEVYSFVQTSMQTSDPDGLAHSQMSRSFGVVCDIADKMREETERSKTTFQRERRECNVIMPAMVKELNRLDSLMDDAHARLTALDIAIRGTLYDGHSSLNYIIEEKLPSEVMTEKVELQRESNVRKADSEENAAEIAEQQRYIKECKEAIRLLKKISGFSPDEQNDSTANVGTIANIISMIENLISDAKNTIEFTTNTEKTNHADYMNTVADTNAQISLLMNQIAEKKGQRSRKLADEISIRAQVEALYTTHHNMGIEFQATCKVYGSTTFKDEDQLDNGASVVNNVVTATDDGQATWSEFAGTNKNGEGLTNQDVENRYTQLIDELNALAGTIQCEQ